MRDIIVGNSEQHIELLRAARERNKDTSEGWLSSSHAHNATTRRSYKQESRAAARKPRDVAAVLYGLKFAKRHPSFEGQAS